MIDSLKEIINCNFKDFSSINLDYINNKLKENEKYLILKSRKT